MYKLNIQKGKKRKYEAVIKQRFFNRLWLTIYRRECDTKREAKAFFRVVANY